MPESAGSWAKRFKLAARFAFYEGGWRGALLRFAGLLSSLGIINGLIDWFLRRNGHAEDAQPLWFTILCALVFPVVVVVNVKLSRKTERPELEFTDRLEQRVSRCVWSRSFHNEDQIPFRHSLCHA